MLNLMVALSTFTVIVLVFLAFDGMNPQMAELRATPRIERTLPLPPDGIINAWVVESECVATITNGETVRTYTFPARPASFGIQPCPLRGLHADH